MGELSGVAITQRPGPGPACEGQALCSGWLSLTQEPEPWARSHRLGACSFWLGRVRDNPRDWLGL